MAIISAFVAPPSAALLARWQVAYTARGFCWAITKSKRTMLDIPMLLNTHRHLNLSRPTSSWTPVGYDLSSSILTSISHFMQVKLYELDLAAINRMFALLPSEAAQHAVLDRANQFFFHSNSSTPRNLRMLPSDKIPQDIYARLEQSLASLEASLLAKDPMMPQHLRASHSILISYPETVHLLEDSEIARLINAAMVHTKTEIVKAVASGKGAGGTRKKVDVSDL